MNEQLIEQYYQCSECKAYKTRSELTKIRTKQNIFQAIRGEEAYKTVCKDCVKNKPTRF